MKRPSPYTLAPARLPGLTRTNVFTNPTTSIATRFLFPAAATVAALLPSGLAAGTADPVLDQDDSSVSHWSMQVDGGVDSTKYNHDSSLILHRGEWILGWNGNTDVREGVSGQKNYFARSDAWNTFRGKPHVAEFQSPEYSTNPVDVDGIEWHPTLLEFAGRLECWWFATSNGAFKRSVGYKSVWDDRARKWTNYKIQLLTHGKVAFSANVKEAEKKDRVTINGTSYVPMPLATVIRGRDGELVMPMIISPSPSGGALGGANEVVVFSSSDQGTTWRWSDIIGKEPGNHRGSMWEPWMTWDGEAYHLFCRNFASVPPGKGYSYSTTKNLAKWPPLADAPLDMMPMRGETVTDGVNWYTALAERPQIGENFNSSKRRGMSLYRSRNGVDWQVIQPLLPAMFNAFYCWPYLPGDGFLYFSCTIPPGISVGRISIADTKEYRVNPERSFVVGANKNPFWDEKIISFTGSDYLRIPATFQHGKGFSFAAYVLTGDSLHGFALDFNQRNATTWGSGFLPSFNSGWLEVFPGWKVDTKTAGVTIRTGELSFVGISFDESAKVMRVVRRNKSDRWETKEWHVQTLFLDKTPTDGLVTMVNGIAYRWRTSPAEPRDVAIAKMATDNLRHLISAVSKNDPQTRSPLLSQMYTTAARAVRIHAMFFFDAPPGELQTDGKCVRSDGNTFDVPKESFTFNANARSADPWDSPYYESGIELWRFGLWNSNLSTDEFKALYNDLAQAHTLPPEATSATRQWSSADILLDPAKPELLPQGFDRFGHVGVKTADGLVLYGDGGAAAEVPGRGDWEWSGEFRFDEFPVNMSWDLLAVGNKFSLGKLEVIRTEDAGYALKRGEKTLCSLKPNEWTKLKINYHGGDADLVLPTASVLRISARPLLHLGRWFADRMEPMEVNRPVSYRTEWRSISVRPKSAPR